MNRVPIELRTQALAQMVEGASMRGTARATGISYNSVARLLVSIGKEAIEFHDRYVRGVKAEFVQCDELWSYVYAKPENALGIKGTPFDSAGVAWTWMAIDKDTKPIIAWVVGDRTQAYGNVLMKDLESRIEGPVKLSTDGHNSYPDAVDMAFWDREHKYVQFGKNDSKEDNEAKRLEGFTQAHIERTNLTTRQSMRRYMRKTTGFSKKRENHIYHTAIHVLQYNWIRPHSTLVDKFGVPTTPAMAAGLAKWPFALKDLIELSDYKNRPGPRGPYKPRKKQKGIVRPPPKEVEPVQIDDMDSRERPGSKLVRTIGYVPPTRPPTDD